MFYPWPDRRRAAEERELHLVLSEETFALFRNSCIATNRYPTPFKSKIRAQKVPHLGFRFSSGILRKRNKDFPVGLDFLNREFTRINANCIRANSRLRAVALQRAGAFIRGLELVLVVACPR
jgi:hypothetical protein